MTALKPLFRDHKVLVLGEAYSERVTVFVEAQYSEPLRVLVVDARVHCPKCDDAGDGCEQCTPFLRRATRIGLETICGHDAHVLRRAFEITDKHFAWCEGVAEGPP